MAAPPGESTVDLKSLTSGKAFFMGSNTEVNWYCTVDARHGDPIRFRVVNGEWRGTLCANTGALLTAAGETVDERDITVHYAGDLPKFTHRSDYNAAFRYVESLRESTRSFQSVADSAPLSP